MKGRVGSPGLALSSCKADGRVADRSACSILRACGLGGPVALVYSAGHRRSPLLRRPELTLEEQNSTFRS